MLLITLHPPPISYFALKTFYGQLYTKIKQIKYFIIPLWNIFFACCILFLMQTNSTTKKAENEIPKENMEALKLIVTNNLLNIQNAYAIEELFDKTYKKLGELCDVDFRTIKRWVTGETKALASGPYEKIRNFIDLIELFLVRNPIELFAWARRTDVTHVIFEYKWGKKSVKESKPLWDMARTDLLDIMKGYKKEKDTKETTDLLVEY